MGNSKSCGCINGKSHNRHSLSNKRIYSIWQNIKSRCRNPNSTQWKWYGGRGIDVCDEWATSFEKFYMDMGEPPTNKHSIDRINNDSSYCKENCKWSTPKEQANNRRPLTPPER